MAGSLALVRPLIAGWRSPSPPARQLHRRHDLAAVVETGIAAYAGWRTTHIAIGIGFTAAIDTGADRFADAEVGAAGRVRDRMQQCAPPRVDLRLAPPIR